MLSQSQQIFEQIQKANNILIIYSKYWNGDSIASALSLKLFLEKINKNADIVAEDTESNINILQHSKKLYSFLPSFDKIQNFTDIQRKFVIVLDTTNANVHKIKYKFEKDSLNFFIELKSGSLSAENINLTSGKFKYDLIISLDASDLTSLGKIYDDNIDFFYQTTIINIDHHADNEKFGQINLIKLTAVSISEILYSVFKNYPQNNIIDKDIATCLLCGIICKTQSFKTGNITPNTLLVVSQLILLGARHEEIMNKLFKSRSFNSLKLWGRILARLSGEINNKLIWSIVTNLDFVKTNTNEQDLQDIIDELIINISQVEVIVLIYETIYNNKSQSNIFVYSVKNINAINLIKIYNPVGDQKSAQIVINKPIQEAALEVVELIKKQLSAFF